MKRGQVVAITATGMPGGSGQHAPCWLALSGPYLDSSNSPSHSLSRFVATGRRIILEQPVAAQTTGAPTDITAGKNRVAVIDADGTTGRLTQFAADGEGNLTQVAVTTIRQPRTESGSSTGKGCSHKPTQRARRLGRRDLPVWRAR